MKKPNDAEDAYRHPDKSAGFEDKKNAIKRDAKWTALALPLIALLGQQFTLNGLAKEIGPVVNNISKPGAPLLLEYLGIAEVFWTSAPLVVALAIIYIMFRKDVLLSTPGMAAAAIVLVLAGTLGNALGFPGFEFRAQYGSTPPGYILGALEAYMNAYGLVTFLSSIVVGIFFGRAYWILSDSDRRRRRRVGRVVSRTAT